MEISWAYEMQKQFCKIQADGSVHAVFIDPGICTPFTWYSPTKGVGKIGQYDIGRIICLCKYMDNLHSIRDKLAASNSKRKNKKALQLDNAISRMIRKIKHLQSEMHKKSAAFFTHEFDAIVIPPFEVSNMVNRKTRNIMQKLFVKCSVGLYRFRQHLVAKAEELGVHVIIQNEAYTSKTCSWCGSVQKIGGSEMYKCRSCGAVMDRDENGARGIFLRALLDWSLDYHAGNNSNTYY